MSNLFLMHITDFKNFKNLIPYEEFNISNYHQGRIGLSLFYNKALIDESYGAIETYFRILGSWLFNDYSYFRGKKFNKVRKDILLYLKLEKYNQLFDIFDIIRNGIHTDMVYTSESEETVKKIRYKFNFYFVKHRPIRYIEHDYLFFILAEISFLMDDILNHDWVKLRDFKENDMPHW